MDEIDFNTLTFIKETINTVNDANIDDKEEYLNTNDTTNHVKINKKLNCKDKAKCEFTFCGPGVERIFEEVKKKFPNKKKIPKNVGTPPPPRTGGPKILKIPL